MYSGNGGFFLFALISAFFIWTAILSFFVWKIYFLLKKIFPNNQGDFKDRLAEVLLIANRLEGVKKQNLDNLQKVSLKRYNPYHDTGGDQSFSLSLLDGHGNGFVITSLHSRSGTRVFAKPVRDGKEDGFELSNEEKSVVKEALEK
jgi:hypothetical protein